MDAQPITDHDAPDAGSGLPIDAPLLTPAGFRPLAALRPDDQVFAADGRTCRLLDAHPLGERDAGRVTFTAGPSMTCGGDQPPFTQTNDERRRGSAGSLKALGAIRRSPSGPSGTSPHNAVPRVG